MERQKSSSKKGDKEEIFADCSFASLGLDSSLCDQLKERLGFEAPTRVQARTIPVVLSGRHVLVSAATGTGKTIAYLAPIIHHLQKRDPRTERSDGTFGNFEVLMYVDVHAASILSCFSLQSVVPLIDYRTEKSCDLVPIQRIEAFYLLVVYEILQKLLHRFHWIVPGYIMGGENRSKEKARLRKGISILVATPGRLLDHLKNTSSFVRMNLQWIVFDEADRILELGFGKEIEEILNILGSRQNGSIGKQAGASRDAGFQRQNLLLSATLNEKVNHLANISLQDPVLIGLDEKKLQLDLSPQNVGSSESNIDQELEFPGKRDMSVTGNYNLPSQLVQRYVKVPCGSRLAVLLSILKHLFERKASHKIVVFFSTCDAVDFHYTLISEFLWSPCSQETEVKSKFLRCKTFRLHGNMKQEDRRMTFQSFKTEKSALLVSTDVAARGLDFPKVKCIIQYDSPGEATEYVHRVGRTARLDERGEALLFLQPAEMDYLKDLEKHGIGLAEYPILKVLDSFPIYGQKLHVKNFVSLDLHPWVLALQKGLELFILAEAKIHTLAKSAYCSWVRAYAAHRGDLKRIFMVKKIHLGHVAKSFALKEQPSLVGQSFQKQAKKRKRDQRPRGLSKKRKVSRKT